MSHNDNTKIRKQILQLKKELKKNKAIDNVLLGKKIKQVRKIRGLSQQSLSDLIGLSRTMVVHIEKGHNSISLNTFLNICYALNISPNRLLEYES
jgi:DNA-binding XRE family transcriptional regulator